MIYKDNKEKGADIYNMTRLVKVKDYETDEAQEASRERLRVRKYMLKTFATKNTEEV